MRVNAFMHSLQARLLAEGVPYAYLNCRRGLVTMAPMVSLVVAKKRTLSFGLTYDVPMDLIRDVVEYAKDIARQVQESL